MALIFSLAAMAQAKTTEYDYKSFTGLFVDDDFVVNVVPGNEYKVSVQAESQYMQYLTVGVSAGNLEIFIDEKAVPYEVRKLFKGQIPVFTAKIVVPKPLQNIELRGKAKLTVEGGISTQSPVSLTIGDNAELKPISITAKTCTVNMEKKGKADIEFNGEKITVDASGSSNLELTRECLDSDITLTGSANLVLRGNDETLTINGKGTSKAALNGSSKTVNYTVGGTSNINAMGLQASKAKVNMSGLSTLTQAAKDSLSLNLLNGSNFIFDGNPVIEIETVKNASINHYDK